MVQIGDYVDYEGGKGNIRTGAYTSGTPSAGAASTTTTSGTRATSAPAATSAATAPPAAATTVGTTNNGGRTFGTDSALGALGVALAFML